MKVKVSLEGFIFPLLSYLTIFTRQSHFLLVFLVLLSLVEAFNKEDNLSCVKWGEKFTEYSDIPLLIGWCNYNQILGTKEEKKEKNEFQTCSRSLIFWIIRSLSCTYLNPPSFPLAFKSFKFLQFKQKQKNHIPILLTLLHCNPIFLFPSVDKLVKIFVYAHHLISF